MSTQTKTTREEYMRWCKQRAIEYADAGDFGGSIASMMSDLGKHEETRGSQFVCSLGLQLIASGNIRTPAQMRKFIEGFN